MTDCHPGDVRDCVGLSGFESTNAEPELTEAWTAWLGDAHGVERTALVYSAVPFPWYALRDRDIIAVSTDTEG